MNEDGSLVRNLKHQRVSPSVSPDALVFLQTRHSRTWFWEWFLHPWGNPTPKSAFGSNIKDLIVTERPSQGMKPDTAAAGPALE